MAAPTQNLPTKTWTNPRWSALTGPLEPLRPIIQSLEQFLARPTFHNGVKVGNGIPPMKDEEGVVTQPPTRTFLQDTIETIETALGSLGTSLADVYADLADMQADLTALETSPIDGTRITDDSIATPKLQANSITATKLAAMNIGVGKWIASTSYNAGVDGWIIAADGTAEFNTVTIRGSVQVGGTITGAIFRTATSGARVVIDGTTSDRDKVMMYDASGNSAGIGVTSGQLRLLAGGSGGVAATDFGGTLVAFTAGAGDFSSMLIAGSTALTAANWSSYVSAGYGYMSDPTFNALSANSVSAGGVNVGGQPVLHTGNYFSYAAAVNGSAFLNFSAADLTYYGTFGYGSDEALKDNIGACTVDALSVVEGTPVRSYTRLLDGVEVESGFIAQEVPSFLQMGLPNPEGGDDIIGIDLGKQVAVLWKAVQQLAAVVGDEGAI